jgi:hypothetical protein
MALLLRSTFRLFSAGAGWVHTGFGELTSARQSVTFGPQQVWVSVMKRIRTTTVMWVVFAGCFLLPAAGASAQTAPQGIRMAQAAPAPEVSAQRRRPPTRLRVYPRNQYDDGVYPRYYPGRNAVRDCTATYVQEMRPSGTVIVPHMNCYWRRG